MKFTKLEQHNIHPLGYGTFPFDQEFWGNTQSDEELIELMIYANKQGVNYFNTAKYYGAGRSEKLLGLAVNEMKRDESYSFKENGY